MCVLVFHVEAIDMRLKRTSFSLNVSCMCVSGGMVEMEFPMDMNNLCWILKQPSDNTSKFVEFLMVKNVKTCDSISYK